MAENKTTIPAGTDDDVQLSRRLRAALGHNNEPGACQDCGGVGNVPSIEATAEAGRSLWRTCPTCRGSGKGGVA